MSAGLRGVTGADGSQQLVAWRQPLRLGARWAALSGAPRRVFAVALSLLLVAVLLTSSVSAELLSGHGVFSSAPGIEISGATAGNGPSSRSSSPAPATSTSAKQPSATPTPAATKPPASVTPTPTPKGAHAPANRVTAPRPSDGRVATANGKAKPIPHPLAHPAIGSSADVLILGTSVLDGTDSIEAQEAASLGLSVEVDDATAWAAKTTTDFENYKAIIIGDPACPGDGPEPYLGPAESNASTWAPAITGNVILIGTDPVFHASSQPGAPALINAGIAYASGRPGTTGLYFTLSCYYVESSLGTDVPVLDAISSPGQFTVQGEEDGCPNAAHIVTASEALAGLSDSILSNWSCSTHEGFDSWPSDYSVLAINEDLASSYVAPDGSSGAPYILARGSAAQGAQGTERLGNGNPSESTSGSNCVCDPVDTYSGNFSHTFDLLDVPGRGIPLHLAMTYNAQAASANGPLGFGWVASAGAALTVDGGTGNVTIAQENGSAATFTPNGSGGYTAPSRVLATLVKNGDGSYTFTRVQDQTHLTFTASGQLTSQADRNGYTTYLAYNGGNQLATITDPAGRALSFSYDGSGHVSTVADPASHSVAYSYDGAGNLATYTDVNGGVWRFTYDSNHLLLTMKDPRGGVTTNVYDSSDRVTSQTDAMGRTTTLSYVAPDSNGVSATTMTDPNGAVTVDHYLNAMLVSETKGSGSAQPATWSYSYDPVSLGLASTIDPNGNISGQTWDANGNLLSQIDNLDRITTYTYNSFDEVTSTTNALGVTTTNTYDAQGNLLSTSTPLVGASSAATTAYTYGDVSHPGDITAMADATGRTSRYTYDANGDRISTTDPLGDLTTSTYDAVGRLLTQVSPNGHVSGANPANYTTTSTYDAFGDVLTTTDPLGKTTTKQYDGDRNLTQTTDADGHTTTSTYDLDNELTQVTRADGSILKYTYDADGNQTGQTDGQGHTTSYAYDALNRQVSVTDPLNRTTSYAYDNVGNRTSATNADGYVTTYGYDAANELTGISYSDGQTPDVSYRYDADGQRISMRDGTGTTSDTYDSLHRLTQETNGAGQTVGYGYDLDGNLTSITYPSGTTVTRSYDSAGRWRTVYDGQGHTTRMRYDADGNLIDTALPNGVDISRSYDRADRLTTIVDVNGVAASEPILSLDYSRDALGQVTAQQQAKPSTALAATNVNQTYSYTSLNQVSSFNGTSYAYDKSDNLVTRGSAALTYDAADQLSSQSNGAATTSYSYDQQGNRTQASVGGSPTAVYGYDQANRLISYNASGASGPTTAQYTYDGDGLRQSKTVNGGASEQFTWDTAEGQPLLLQDGATQYIYGPGGTPIEQVGGNGTLYYLTDQLGSTRALVDSLGAVLATYTYDAYGTLVSRTGNLSASANPFGFAGQYTDAESGLIYLRARSYDPATAQFLTRDPLESLTQQPYGYVGGDPLNATDPSGALVIGFCGGVAGGYGGGAQGQVCNETDFHQFANTLTGGLDFRLRRRVLASRC